MSHPLIIVIDDDITLRELMQELLTDEGYRVVPWDGVRGAVALIERLQPGLVILDIRLPRLEDGRALLERLLARPATRAIPILVCSADGRFIYEQAAQLRQRGVATIEKPFDLSELLEQITAQIAAPRADIYITTSPFPERSS